MNLHSTVEEGSFTGGEIYKRPLMHMSLEHGLIFQKKKVERGGSEGIMKEDK